MNHILDQRESRYRPRKTGEQFAMPYSGIEKETMATGQRPTTFFSRLLLWILVMITVAFAWGQFSSIIIESIGFTQKIALGHFLEGDLP